jgi:hypothetical protein
MISFFFDGSISPSVLPSSTATRSCEARLQVDGNAVLFEHVGKRFIRQFLKRRHPVAPELLQLVESVVIEGDQLAHDRACLLRRKQTLNNSDGSKSFRFGTGAARGR